LVEGRGEEAEKEEREGGKKRRVCEDRKYSERRKKGKKGERRERET